MFPVVVRHDRPALFGHFERRLCSLVDDVADADGRKDLEEVGRDASVEAGQAFLLQDFPSESDESLLGIFWRWKQTKDTFVIWQRHPTDAPNDLSRQKRVE